MAIEGVHPNSKIVQFSNAVVLVIHHHDVGICPACNTFAVDLQGVGAAFRWLDLVPIRVAFLVESAAHYCR